MRGVVCVSWAPASPRSSAQWARMPLNPSERNQLSSARLCHNAAIGLRSVLMIMSCTSLSFAGKLACVTSRDAGGWCAQRAVGNTRLPPKRRSKLIYVRQLTRVNRAMCTPWLRSAVHQLCTKAPQPYERGSPGGVSPRCWPCHTQLFRNATKTKTYPYLSMAQVWGLAHLSNL